MQAPPSYMLLLIMRNGTLCLLNDLIWLVVVSIQRLYPRREYFLI